MRWEWRTFGDSLGAAEARLGALEPARVQASDETYLLSPAGRDTVKARDGLLDVKHLEQVDDNGLELWRPVMKSPLPVSAEDAGAALAALAVDVPPPASGTYDVDDLAGASADVLVVPVHKLRRRFTVGGCMAELTDIRAGERATRTIAIESEVPEDVIAAVRALGLSARPNVSVPRGLAALLASA